MPFKSTSELPPAVRDALPAAAQRVFLKVFNENASRGETTAFRLAWVSRP